MLAPVKIVVAGIGGVGGYFGGLLAKCYAGIQDREVYFIARGKHLKKIQEDGLTVIKGSIKFEQKPFLATDNPSEVGLADYIIISTKNYDLDTILSQLAPCVGTHTVILPLLNGVEAVKKIRAKFPNHLVASGCAYIVSAITAPGVIENMGTRQQIYFGLENAEDIRLQQLEDLMKFAGIECRLSKQIEELVWEKFIFLSSIATATSFYKTSIGALLDHHSNYLISLLKEATSIAIAKNIKVDENIVKNAMAHYNALPYPATSSLQRDFQANKSKTELDSITGYVVNEGVKLNVKTPLFDQALSTLQKST